MKNIFSIIILLNSFILFAQNDTCEGYTRTKYDKFTNTTEKESAKLVKVFSNDSLSALVISLSRPSVNMLLLNFKVVNGKDETICLKTKSKIAFVFKDETRLMFDNGQKDNCSGKASIMFLNLVAKGVKTFSDYKIFAKQRIDAIRVITEAGAFDFDLSDTNQQDVLLTANCLTKN